MYFSVLPMLFNFSGVGFGSTLVLYSTSVGTQLDSTPIYDNDSLSFDCKSGSEFLYASYLFLFLRKSKKNHFGSSLLHNNYLPIE